MDANLFNSSYKVDVNDVSVSLNDKSEQKSAYK